MCVWVLDFQKFSSDSDISPPTHPGLFFFLCRSDCVVGFCEVFGGLYLLAYVLEKPSGFWGVALSRSPVSCPFGSLGNAIFCECTPA